MKPHVCPKCEGEALRMMSCAPCKGCGIVWSPTADPILAPNPYVSIPQPYIYPQVVRTIGPWPPQITWGGTCQVDSTPGTITCTSDGPMSFSTSAIFAYSGPIQ